MNKQTAVQWLIDHIMNPDGFPYNTPEELFEMALQMEKEQIMKAARQCHFEGVRQSAKTSEDYIAYGEQYYNETFKTDNNE